MWCSRILWYRTGWGFLKLGPRWGQSVERVAAKRRLCAVVVGLEMGEVVGAWCVHLARARWEQGGGWGTRRQGREAGITSGGCTFWVREWGGLNRVVRGLEMGWERWCSTIVVVGDGSGCTPWWWSLTWWGRDAVVTSGDRTFVGFGFESRRAQSGGWGIRGQGW